MNRAGFKPTKHVITHFSGTSASNARANTAIRRARPPSPYHSRSAGYRVADRRRSLKTHRMPAASSDSNRRGSGHLVHGERNLAFHYDVAGVAKMNLDIISPTNASGEYVSVRGTMAYPIVSSPSRL
jgi:hypothetical protein